MKLDFSVDAPKLAEQLIGWKLTFEDGGFKRGGIICETEAYTQDDPASHSFKGPNKRNASMFMKPGTIYVYKIYGIHYCLNFVCGNYDGQAVLIRAIEPTEGIEILKRNRRNPDNKKLCNGPAKLFEAFGFDPFLLNGKHITETGLTLLPPEKEYKILSSRRIGISKGKETLWRFSL